MFILLSKLNTAYLDGGYTDPKLFCVASEELHFKSIVRCRNNKSEEGILTLLTKLNTTKQNR